MRVLYVEDDAASVQLVATVLRRRGRDVLLSARTGQAGLRLAAGVRPDLVLLDLALPDMTGEAVLRSLQGASPGSAPPVVVVSADARPETAARLLAAGAGHFLTKPLDLAELERRLDAAAAATAGAAVA
jgi:DNA-binding response OmpR family regulator